MFVGGVGVCMTHVVYVVVKLPNNIEITLTKSMNNYLAYNRAFHTGHPTTYTYLQAQDQYF